MDFYVCTSFLGIGGLGGYGQFEFAFGWATDIWFSVNLYSEGYLFESKDTIASLAETSQKDFQGGLVTISHSIPP